MFHTSITVFQYHWLPWESMVPQTGDLRAELEQLQKWDGRDGGATEGPRHQLPMVPEEFELGQVSEWR